MTAKILNLLHKLDKRICQFIKKNGILDAEDQETKVYKANMVLSLAQSLLTEEMPDPTIMDSMIQLLSNIVDLLELGNPEFESEQQIRQLFRQILTYIKGVQLSLELNELDSDEDIPEHVHEAYEPYINPETGECEYPTNLSFHEQVLWSFHLRRKDHTQSPQIRDAVDKLSIKMQCLSATLHNEYQVDLGDGLIGVANPQIGLQNELQEMRKATVAYFEPTHLAKTAEVARVAQAYYQKQAISTDLTAGSLIIAVSEALRSVHLLRDNLEQHDTTLDWQGVSLSLQRKPSTNNLGNLFIRNVGCYGHRKEGKKAKFNVLDDFKSVIAYSGEELFKIVITKYGSNPSMITCKMLKLPESLEGQKILKKLKQNLFLIFCAEIFRYFPIEENTRNKVKAIPFAVALSIGLELLYTGEIELEDLFDHNAKLGLPTGRKILDNPNQVSEKLYRLIEVYQKYLESSSQNVSRFKDAFPQGMVVSTNSQHVDRLQTYLGKHLK